MLQITPELIVIPSSMKSITQTFISMIIVIKVWY